MQKILENRMFISVFLSVVLTFAFVFAVAYGTTTISTNITTAGTLTISTSLNGPLQVNAGVVSATTTLTTMYGGTGLSTGGLKASYIPFGNDTSAFATSTYLSFTSPILTATFASTTALTNSGLASSTSLRVGNGPDVSTVSGLSFGYCNTTGTGNITASSTGYLVCTPQTAGSIASNSRVFVQATSSLPAYFVIVAASSTAVDTISVKVANIGWAGTQATGGLSLNFIGIR